RSRLLPLLTIPAMLVIVELAALFLSIPMQSAGITAFEDPESVANPFIFIIILLLFTGFLLLLLRFRWKKLIGVIIGLSIFFTFIYIFAGIAGYFLGLTVGTLAISLILSAGATVLLYLYPEWYVIDILGILIAAGAASIFGISLTIIPVIILLVILMVYDAISVYKTRHMITLAEGVVDMKSPILFIVPKKRGYSYRTEGIGSIGEGERAAYLIGMGDLIMPSILVVSATVFLDVTRIGFITLPSLGAIIGSVIGLFLLLLVVQKGKPQAGLPPINGGAIIGFLAGYGFALLL
ncbi:MAG TPA: presenilin family intramembrane aspartyl protease PSH, partial [Methanoregulaceae archaeon]|nr:presenilin family intramembrane aspartyl protease PSH [Methanoregulaceae archaeon]